MKTLQKPLHSIGEPYTIKTPQYPITRDSFLKFNEVNEGTPLYKMSKPQHEFFLKGKCSLVDL